MSASVTRVPQYDVSLGRTLLGNWVEEVSFVDFGLNQACRWRPSL